MKPLIALTLGDACGIGPELVARLLSAPIPAHAVVIGDEWLLESGAKISKTSVNLPKISRIEDARNHDTPVLFATDTLDPKDASLGKVSAKSGEASLKNLQIALNFARDNSVDGICFAPLNKQAMKAGGLKFEDELHFFADFLGVRGYFCEFNTLGDLWTSRISSHIPLKNAYKFITIERIFEATKLIFEAVKNSGITDPKIAIAAFNPHAGEGGTCGREELETIMPAVLKCIEAGLPVTGPVPADTVFMRAQNGEFNAVVTMYHDQGQIAIKLLGFSRGVTVQGGLPIAITTPAHGTAFDIAGRGVADVSPMKNAFNLAARLGSAQKRQMQ